MSEKNTYLKKINDAHLLCDIVEAAEVGVLEAVAEDYNFIMVVKFSGIWSRATETMELIDAEKKEIIEDLGDEWYGWHSIVQGNLHLIIADMQQIIIEGWPEDDEKKDSPLYIINQSALWAIDILNDKEDEGRDEGRDEGINIFQPN